MKQDYWENLIKLGHYIKYLFEIEDYIDKEGTHWVGFGDAPDEVWIIKNGNGEVRLTKQEMFKKMFRELSDREEYNV